MIDRGGPRVDYLVLFAIVEVLCDDVRVSLFHVLFDGVGVGGGVGGDEVGVGLVVKEECAFPVSLWCLLFGELVQGVGVAVRFV